MDNMKATRMNHKSESLYYCLKFDWGFNTTLVNARAQFFDNGYNAFKKWERLFNHLNHNVETLYSISKKQSILLRVLRKINGVLKKLIH